MNRKFFTLNGEYVKVEISPTIVETLDETLDNLTVTLVANKVPNPYAPIATTICLVEGDPEDKTTWNILSPMRVASDDVTIFSTQELTYQHTITAIQNHEFLKKHVLRNTVFSSSVFGSEDINVKTDYSCSMYLSNKDIEGEVQYDQYKITKMEFPGFENSNGSNVSGESTSALLDLGSVDLSNDFYMQIHLDAEELSNSSFDTSDFHLNTKKILPSTWKNCLRNVTYHGLEQHFPIIRFVWYKENGTQSGDSYSIDLNEGNRLNEDFADGDVISLTDEDYEFIREYSNKDGVSYAKIYIINYGDLDALVNNKYSDGTYYNFIYNPQNHISYLYQLKLGVSFHAATTNNVYKVIETILNQNLKETELYNRDNDNENLFPLFKLPDENRDSELYHLLKSTPAPNFVFTQSSVFDALAEIFKLFDATFTIDDEGYLKIEYFNEHSPLKEKIKVAGKRTSISENKFTNKLISYFQNAQIIDKFPNSTDPNAVACVRSNTLGVADDNSRVFEVPKKIYLLKKVMVYCPNLNLGKKYTRNFKIVEPDEQQLGIITIYINNELQQSKMVDITDFVVEEKLYNLLDDSTYWRFDKNETIKKSVANCISYSQGSKYIKLGMYFNDLVGINKSAFRNAVACAVYSHYPEATTLFETTFNFNDLPDWRDVRMSVEYIALADGRIQIESLENKYDGEEISNQGNGSIDINKLGLNMVGLGLKLGQPTLNMTQQFSNWNDRIKKGEFFIDEYGQKWVANVCNYTIINSNLIQSSIEFSKNFNSLATRIKLNSEKRLSNISGELTQKCEENYGEFVYFSESEEEAKKNSEQIVMSQKNTRGTGFTFERFFTGICRTFEIKGFKNYVNYKDENEHVTNLSKYKVEHVSLTPLMKNDKKYLYNNHTIENVACPLLVYGSGNSVCYEMSFESPISAGNQLLTGHREGHLILGDYFSKVVPYCNLNGEAEKFDIDFVIMNEPLTEMYPELKRKDGYPLDCFSVGRIKKMAYYKKPNEIFALNYQINFLPIPGKIHDLFLGNEFIKNCCLFKEETTKGICLYYSNDDEKYTILDIDGISKNGGIIRQSPTSLEGLALEASAKINRKGDAVYFELKFTIPNEVNYKTWAICDRFGKIYYSSNEEGTGKEFKIYLIPRHHRL